MGQYNLSTTFRKIYVLMKMKEGIESVKLARQAIKKWLDEKKKIGFSDLGYLSESFMKKRGCFVTINTYPENELRGCIGFPEPIMPLWEAIIESAVSACNDPRFPSLKKDEYNKIIIEVSILTKPKLIEVNNAKDYPKKIKIGRDGLIIEKGFRSGLLLPQVATENRLDAEDFLLHLCLKAGLPYTAWLDPDVKIYKFSAEIFSEKRPNGEIIKKS